MTKDKVRYYVRLLNQLDPGTTEYEDMTETIIAIYGISGIDLILFDGLRPVRNRFLPLLNTLLITDNPKVKNTIIGYFLATTAAADDSARDFLLKYMEFQRVMMARAEVQRRQQDQTDQGGGTE